MLITATALFEVYGTIKHCTVYNEIFTTDFAFWSSSGLREHEIQEVRTKDFHGISLDEMIEKPSILTRHAFKIGAYRKQKAD